MTNPTFQELLTSQEARERAAPFKPVEGNGTHFMTLAGTIMNFEKRAIHGFKAVWQGYIQEVAPPPEPRVFKRTVYFNVYDYDGVSPFARMSRQQADQCCDKEGDRLACVRVEVTATEGQYDD